MPKKSAGILAYRIRARLLQILLVHPGGPFWKNKDIGVWSIPKGEFTDDEEPLDAARREFKEELGLEIKGDFIPLAPIKQKGGKQVFAFAIENDVDTTNIVSNTISINWPPKSNRQIVVPEVDKAEWVNIIDAAEKIIPAQVALIDDLLGKVFRITNEQLEKVKILSNIIKQRRLINFYYQSNEGRKDKFLDWRKVEPYMVGIYTHGPKKDKISCTGYFRATSQQNKEGRVDDQGNYYLEKINMDQFEVLEETYDEIQIQKENIHDTKTMIIFYRTGLRKFT